MDTRDSEWSPRCRRPAALARPVRLDPSGTNGPTRGQSRGPHWRQTSHGFYVRASVSDDVPEQRILEQSVRLSEGGAVTAWAACRLAGAAYFDGLAGDGATRRPVPLISGTGSSLRHDDRASVSRDRLDPGEVVGLDLGDVDRVVDRMLATRARAAWVAPRRRGWTLTPPPGWYASPWDAMTLDERLEHRAWLRGA